MAEPTEQGGVRYRLLEPIRQYALEKLEQSGKSDDVKRAHAEHYLALVEEAEPELIGPREAEWLERLEVDHDNIRAALLWTSEQREAEVALQAAGALMSFWFWEGHAGGAQVARGAEPGWPHHLRAGPSRRLGAASLLAWRQSDYPRAE